MLYERGEHATGLYFLVKGCVELSWGLASKVAASASESPPRSPVPGFVGGAAAEGGARNDARLRGAGDIFGELALFPELAGELRPERALVSEMGLAYMLPVPSQTHCSTLYLACTL